MTQEEKRLLYKDLSARQPYRPLVCFSGKITMPLLDIIASTKGNELMAINGLGPEYIKPYLRPMSSMSEEECKELGDLPAIIENVGETLPNIPYYIEVVRPEQFDWLNFHHFDYHGLIEKGLALEAPEGMY